MNPNFYVSLWYGLIKNRGGVTIRRSAVLCSIILCTTFLVSCANNNSKDPSKESPTVSIASPVSSAETPAPSTEPPAVATESPVASPENESHSLGESFLALIDEGKVSDTELAIGESTELLIQRKGDPESTDYFEGGQYFNYGTVTYFTDANVNESNQLVHGHIGFIGLASGYEIFGLKLGEANLKQVESTLGTSYVAQSPEDNSDSYLLSEMWSYEYRTDHYRLIFYADSSDEVIDGALLLKNGPE